MTDMKQAKKNTVGPGTQKQLTQKQAEMQARAKREDQVARARATEGCRDQETLDAVLALGGDASRSSPVREQVLPEADAGYTTTTGAYRTPIDPMTAAVPALEDSEIVRDMGRRTSPTVGSSGLGEPEERWKGPETGDTAAERMSKLPTKEEYDKKDAEALREVATAGQPKSDKPAEQQHPM